jgi:hypothetical protein
MKSFFQVQAEPWWKYEFILMARYTGSSTLAAGKHLSLEIQVIQEEF